MSSRYFFGLCALALVAAAVAAPVEEVDIEDVQTEDNERIWPVLAAWVAEEGIAYLKKHFIKIKVECFPDVIKNCHLNVFYHPKMYYKCAKNYFESHAERCMKHESNPVQPVAMQV